MGETISFFLTLLMEPFSIPGISFPQIGVIKIIFLANHGLGLNEIILIEVKKLMWLLSVINFIPELLNSI